MKGFVSILVLLAMLAASSCQPVKPYQRSYLNDHEMQFGQQGAKILEENAQVYREGAMGGGSSKTSGGCGCN
ncbi:MAG TPA: DUF4266 domain-containing protein [Cyclobacteriaceae bacterium]|nr:DUF4266 domain-containing protein [Cyclobacteriaceae bacterium]